MNRNYFFIALFFVSFVNAQVGIGTTSPQGTLHIYEANGTVANPNTGTIVLQHGNAGGESSIVFRSTSNAGNDYGYIKYQDDGSGNGSTNENGLLTIGIENDGPSIWQDDINLRASGSVGISNTAPNPSASLDLGSNNKGLLINRVALSSTTDTGVMASAPATGLLIFNTANVNDVTQGFYYFNGSRWVKVGVNNYSIEYNQNNEAAASGDNTVYVDLPGLTQTFVTLHRYISNYCKWILFVRITYSDYFY